MKHSASTGSVLTILGDLSTRAAAVVCLDVQRTGTQMLHTTYALSILPATSYSALVKKDEVHSGMVLH